MGRLYLFSLCMLVSVFTMAQQVKSPSAFLGYAPGERFTHHDRILGYFRDCAATDPAQMTLIPYGQSDEGRDLMVAVVSSPANMQQLEAIRINNLRLAGQLTDGPADVKMPAVVWLSYNVHGNEASSSEVAMVLLYELLSGKKPGIRDWLNNVVLIIDPCLNPDGRERYVHWYNQMKGKNSHADPYTREHDEPWPGGRTNHYYFDLNRDWAWQTQTETRQRISLYQRWMPSIHGDYHEQYPESPYYFAPAAEPFHDAITDFQRSFQHSIGLNHARYFDANGWLYFTREYFDLFYPAYGDTYPIFNGSVGMTYEQAGHSMAGLSVALAGGDTLKLTDRIEHHLTTSLSTIEVAAGQSVKLNSEFMTYFSDARKKGSGLHKGYLVSGANDRKLSELKELLTLNMIKWKNVKEGVAVKGYNYFTGKDEISQTKNNDILVHADQVQAHLVRVLFEPLSRLADSATYDITAWALPYVYGVQCYALRDKLPETKVADINAVSVVAKSSYAWLLGYSSFSDGRLLALLLRNGIRVRVTEKDIVYQGKTYQKGTMIILHKENIQKMELFHQLVLASKAVPVPVQTGFMDAGFDLGSDKMHQLKAPVVAVLSGEETIPENLGEIWHLFDQQMDYPISLINSRNLSSLNLSKYDVLIVPDGSYKFISDKDIAQSVKNWVKQGGKMVVAGQVVSQFAAAEWGIRVKKNEEEKPEEKVADYADLKKYEDRDKDLLSGHIPGAIYRVELDKSHPLCFGYPDNYFTLKQNGLLLEFLKEGWNAGVIKKDRQVSGFVGYKLRDNIKDGTVLAVQPLGKGSVVYFTDNPLFRSFWQNGKLLFINSVFLNSY